MNTLNYLLDKAKEVCVSDAAIARKLGVSPSAVSLWRSGGKITSAHVAKLITLTQQDPALAVQVLAEQDAPPEERRMWGALWDRLSPAISTVAGVLLLVGLAAPQQVQAGTSAPAMYIMSIARGLRRAWTRFLRACHASTKEPVWTLT